MNIQEIFEKGGPVMWPLLVLSILSVSVILERLIFWISTLTKEQQVVNEVLVAARRGLWGDAYRAAKQMSDQPMGRLLFSPLSLNTPDPDVFSLALEASADHELAAMRRGDKLLEAVITMSPMLGLLGTVLGLINSLGSIRLGDIGTSSTADVTLGIAEALITTATGLIVALISLTFYRLFQGLFSGQVKAFRKAGNELELLYRQNWPQVKSQLSPIHEQEREDEAERARQAEIDRQSGFDFANINRPENLATPDMTPSSATAGDDHTAPYETATSEPEAKMDSTFPYPEPQTNNSSESFQTREEEERSDKS
ncbi:MAG: MotA/TolQ/ExbB proton channel family protein [Microcoleaceae cyanobacterium]